MDNPCKCCADNPHFCRGMCIEKMKYIRETGEMPVIKEVKVSNPSKKVDYNKNGIRRETRCES